MSPIVPASDTRLRVTLLGTGSPSPSLSRHHPAALVQWGAGSAVLVDAGGPAGTVDMHRRLVEDFYRDQAEWAMALGYARGGWDDIAVRDLAHGWTADIDGCRVDAAVVEHPPMAALAYRFTYGGRSVVISGDCRRCDGLVSLSVGADVLVADACAPGAGPDASPGRRAIVERLHEFHASPQDCVDMAALAGVGMVVLTHLLPEAEPIVDTAAFAGRVVIGRADARRWGLQLVLDDKDRDGDDGRDAGRPG